jgi:hypothetical protein
MKRVIGVLLLIIASIPVAFCMYAWLDIHGLKPTESFVIFEWFALSLQVGSFFLGSALLF